MCDTQCHTRALNKFVTTSHDTHLGKFFWTFKIFATTRHALLHLTRIPTHSVTSSSLIGTPTVCRASVRLDLGIHRDLLGTTDLTHVGLSVRQPATQTACQRWKEMSGYWSSLDNGHYRPYVHINTLQTSVAVADCKWARQTTQQLRADEIRLRTRTNCNQLEHVHLSNWTFTN